MVTKKMRNEPKTNPIYPDSNPICEKNTKIYAIGKYNFSQLFDEKVPVLSLSKYNFSQLFTTFRPKNMRNEPNFKNPQMNLTPVKTKDYENKRPSSHRQNEPNSNPICWWRWDGTKIKTPYYGCGGHITKGNSVCEMNHLRTHN